MPDDDAGAQRTQNVRCADTPPYRSTRSRRRRHGLALGWLLVLACAPPAPQRVDSSVPAPARPQASARTVAVESDTPASRAGGLARVFHNHVAYLASDTLEGRGTGTKGNDLAAEYIAAQFRRAGLQPAGVKGSYFQPFEVTLGQKLTDRASLRVTSASGTPALHTDFVPLPFSSGESFDGRVAFAGYGITHKEAGYDDYAGFEAKGKVLLILRYEPHDADPDAKFGGKSPSSYATFQSKARSAREHGAAALLIVNPPLHHGDEDRLFRFDSVEETQSYDIPMMHVSRDLAAGLLRAANAPELKALQNELDTARKPRSFDLAGVRARGTPGVVREMATTRNVLGLLPGRGPLADEYIVIGAHYDHLGITVPRGAHGAGRSASRVADTQPAPGPEIHNGADDNASGTAGLILLAKSFGQVAEDGKGRAGKPISPVTRGTQGGPEGRDTPLQIATEDDNWQSRFDQIKVGMSKKNVESILGSPTDPLSSPERGTGYGPAPAIESWESPSDFSRIRIHYSAQDRVASKKIYLTSAHKRQMHEKQSGNRRSLLFIAFSGEEIGLLGSMHYVNHPTVPLERTVAMLNMDMIGRLRDNRLQVFGIKTADPFEPLVSGYAKKFGFELQTSAGGFGPSDHTAFYGKKIPVMHFFTGIHNEYHRPGDDTETLNAPGAARVIDLIAAVIGDLREMSEPPRYVAIAESRPSRTGLKVRMGVMPSYAEDEQPGMLIDGVSPGSPAEKAGLKSGDRLLMIGDTAIHSVYDLMDAMGKYEPGNEANLTVLRAGRRMQMAVKFEAP